MPIPVLALPMPTSYRASISRKGRWCEFQVKHPCRSHRPALGLAGRCGTFPGAENPCFLDIRSPRSATRPCRRGGITGEAAGLDQTDCDEFLVKFRCKIGIVPFAVFCFTCRIFRLCQHTREPSCATHEDELKIANPIVSFSGKNESSMCKPLLTKRIRLREDNRGVADVRPLFSSRSRGPGRFDPFDPPLRSSASHAIPVVRPVAVHTGVTSWACDPYDLVASKSYDESSPTFVVRLPLSWPFPRRDFRRVRRGGDPEGHATRNNPHRRDLRDRRLESPD